MSAETINCLVCGETHSFGLQCGGVAPPVSLRPIGSRLLVQPDPAPKRSTLIETVEYVPPPETSGRVVALGRQFLCEASGTARGPRVAIGDRVFFSGTVGQDVAIGREHFVMLDERDVLAVAQREETR